MSALQYQEDDGTVYYLNQGRDRDKFKAFRQFPAWTSRRAEGLPGLKYTTRTQAQAYAGTAVLTTHRSQLEALGEPEYLRIQQRNGHCPKDFGYPGCLTPEGEEKECGICWAIGGAKWVRFERNAQYQTQKGKG